MPCRIIAKYMLTYTVLLGLRSIQTDSRSTTRNVLKIDYLIVKVQKRAEFPFVYIKNERKINFFNLALNNFSNFEFCYI